MTLIKHSYKNGFMGVLRPKAKKLKVGQDIEIDVPIKIAHDNQGDKLFVDDGTSQFWVHRSVVKNNHIVARVKICNIKDNRYEVQLFYDKFWVKEGNIKKVLA